MEGKDGVAWKKWCNLKVDMVPHANPEGPEGSSFAWPRQRENDVRVQCRGFGVRQLSGSIIAGVSW